MDDVIETPTPDQETIPEKAVAQEPETTASPEPDTLTEDSTEKEAPEKVYTQAELDAVLFNNTAGNPYGNVNVYRALRTISGGYEVKSEGQSIYLQDTWTLDQLTINAGLRAEKSIFESVAKEKALTGDTEKKLVDFLDKFAKGFTA